MEKLLITDDNEEIRTQLKWGFSKEYVLLLARDGAEALALFKKNNPRVTTLDLGTPPHENGTEEGFRCLQEMLRHNPGAKVIVITGNDQRENALKAVHLGAYDFYQKPINLEELKVIVRRAFYLSAIEEQNRTLHSALERQTAQVGGMIGQCPEMQAVFSTMRKIASSDAAVLVQGESGTGKELVARAIHAMSLRKNGPFLSRLTAVRSRRRFLNPSSSVMRRDRSPGPMLKYKVRWNMPRTGRSSSMRSENFPLRSR